MSNTGWADELEYLLGSRFLYHNDDYLEFLVKRVWKLERACKLLDFGCGFGFMGSKLLPLLPSGSSYTGIDSSRRLLEKGRDLFAESPLAVELVEGDIYDVPFPNNICDVALCHAVLMHLEKPEDVLMEMIRVTRDSGIVVACEGNRLGHNALVYVDEFAEHPTFDLGVLQKHHKYHRDKTGADSNIGIRMPVLFHRAGLKKVESRLSDRIVSVLPGTDPESHERMYRAICEEGLGKRIDSETGKRIQREFADCGLGEEEAESRVAELARMAEDFIENGREYHIVWPGLLVFTSGEVAKSARR